MKAELKERTKKKELTIAERKMEANKISSLQARIRSKMQNKVQNAQLERSNQGLNVLMNVMFKNLEPSKLREIFTEVA